jgi:acetyl esterase
LSHEPPAGPEAPLVTPASANPVLDPTTQRFIDELAATGRLPREPFGVAAARAWLTALQSGPISKPAADILDLAWPIGPTGRIEVRIVRPPGVAGLLLPVVIYLHGGGWVMGDRHTHDRLVRELAIGAQAAIVFVEYTRAPEAQYPVQVEQAYAVLTHVAAHGTALGLDPARIAVAGDGCGGSMATALGLLAKRRKGPPPAFQLLLYPLTASLSDRGSLKTFESGPWLSIGITRAFCAVEFPDPAVLMTDIACPLVTTLANLEDQPPALVITAENDILRDDGEAYARRLMQADVNVVATRYNGTIRDFMMLDGLAESPPARAATAQAIEALRAAFGP